ncbi:small-conductance mechanosensitive channel [Texcoconibacillus texcoconensis]|uniref:Small-conductance mechanosensitive channel n=1 Tax=Texcoconibacillus texcoconensis TaxID=1095777 RepID=A0A840QM34_9BACI|nr:small-conductance mechanosensitive channel [Texcoconibacillus texcoconensis]
MIFVSHNDLYRKLFKKCFLYSFIIMIGIWIVIWIPLSGTVYNEQHPYSSGYYMTETQIFIWGMVFITLKTLLISFLISFVFMFTTRNLVHPND